MTNLILARPCQSEKAVGRCENAQKKTVELGKHLSGLVMTAAFSATSPRAGYTLFDLLTGSKQEHIYDVELHKDISEFGPNVAPFHEDIVTPRLRKQQDVLVIPDIAVFKDYVVHVGDYELAGSLPEPDQPLLRIYNLNERLEIDSSVTH